eukprot:scaffold846_cov168-Amphora_coffeaeformis.AAC.29
MEALPLFIVTFNFDNFGRIYVFLFSPFFFLFFQFRLFLFPFCTKLKKLFLYGRNFCEGHPNGPRRVGKGVLNELAKHFRLPIHRARDVVDCHENIAGGWLGIGSQSISTLSTN